MIIPMAAYLSVPAAAQIHAAQWRGCGGRFADGGVIAVR